MRQRLPAADPLHRLAILSDERQLEPSSFQWELGLLFDSWRG